MVSWSKSQSLDFIPSGKLVTFTALHQSSAVQYVQIIDSNNQPISFTTLSGESARFPISGQGATVAFLTNGAGRFAMQKGLQIQFGSSNSSPPKVAAANPNEFFINGDVVGGGTLFVTEDGDDNDYNDTSFVIEWYKYQG